MATAPGCIGDYNVTIKFCSYALYDGYVEHTGATHALARDATTGTTALTTGGGSTYRSRAIEYQHAKGAWRITRTFIAFNTSAITTTVTSAKLYIYGYQFTNGDIIAIKSTWDGSSNLTTSDYDSLDFSTAYSSKVSSWTDTAYNEITLNTQARADMKSNSTISFALINYEYDSRDVSSTNIVINGMYYSEYSGTGKDPELGWQSEAVVVNTPVTLSSGVINLNSGLITIT